MKRNYSSFKSYQKKDGTTSYYPNNYQNNGNGNKPPEPAGPSVTITLPPGQQQAYSFQMVINPVSANHTQHPGQQTNLYPVPPLPQPIVNSGNKTIVPLQVVSAPLTEKPKTTLFDLMQQKSAPNTNATSASSAPPVNSPSTPRN